MSNYLNTHILLIDTKHIHKKKIYTNTNFVVKSDGVNKKTIKKISLVELEFPGPREAPELYYNFEKYIKNNSSFMITIKSIDYIIIINDNWYTLDTLVHEINLELNNIIITKTMIQKMMLNILVDKLQMVWLLFTHLI